MFELTTGADASGLQSVAEVAELHRRRHRYDRGYRRNACLVTLNGSLNDVGILNVFNRYGYW